MGPRGWWIRFVGIALMTVLVVALAQTATPPAAASEAYVVVTSAEQVLGTWSTQIGGPAIRFEEDGAYREAWTVATLDSAPFVISTYGFDTAVMIVAGGTAVGVPDCGDAVGRYEVRLFENGSLQMVPIEDPCSARREHMQRTRYERVE